MGAVRIVGILKSLVLNIFNPPTRSTLVEFIVGIVIILFVGVLTYNSNNVLRTLDFKIYDLYLKSQIREVAPASKVPVIVDIEEDSMKEYGQWPWPRYLLAKLLYKIRDYGSLSIGVDIIFPDYDRTSPKRLKNSFKKYLNLNISYIGIPPSLDDNDIILAKAINETNSVIPVEITYKKNLDYCNISSLNVLQKSTVQVDVLRNLSNLLPSAKNIICPIKPILDVSDIISYNSVSPDYDGVFRKVPLIYTYKNKVIPYLPVAALLKALKTNVITVYSDENVVQGISIKNLNIKTDRNGEMSLTFHGGTHSYDYYLAKDVLENNIPEDALKNKIVFVGSSATGLFDVRNTPFESAYPGIETNAVVIDNILKSSYIYFDEGTSFAYQTIYFVVLAGLIILISLLFTKPLYYVMSTLIAIALVIWKSITLYVNYGVFVSPLSGVLVIVLMLIFVTIIKFRNAEKSKKIIKDVFNKYMSPAVVKKILKRPKDLMSGEVKRVTIFFSDIRNFTTISENLSPTVLIQILNIYFTKMTSCVKNTEGTLDKFIGDAIMAFWNAPLDVKNHEEKAVKTALDMIEKLKTINKEIANISQLKLHFGIGIHTGSVFVGNMGAKDAINYTIIGDSVNLTSRLEDLTKEYRVRILISEESLKQVNPAKYAFIFLDKIVVKGKASSVNIYTVLTEDEEKELESYWLPFQKAHDLYMDGNFKGSHKILKGLKSKYFQQTNEVFIHRCEALMKNPPANWEGIFTFTKK